jgi:hypothetical protein
MKSFKDILTESKKTYKFIVRVAGDLPEGFAGHLETNLKKFDLVGVSSGKRTPIQERPLDFPQLQNIETHTFEAEVNYPTTPSVLENYLTDNCMVPRGHLIVRVPGEPLEKIQEPTKESPYESLLNTTEMGGESAQPAVGGNRVMDLLKELETARKEREIDPVSGITTGKSNVMDDKTNTKSPMGS